MPLPPWLPRVVAPRGGPESCRSRRSWGDSSPRLQQRSGLPQGTLDGSLVNSRVANRGPEPPDAAYFDGVFAGGLLAKSPALTRVNFAGSRCRCIAATISSGVNAATFFSKSASQASVRFR